MFSYTIRPRPSLPLGTTINSRVGIYFDYNDVLMTNTAQNIKGCPSPAFVKNSKSAPLILHPNPVNDELTLLTGSVSYSEYTIVNMLGQEVMRAKVMGNSTKVNVKGLTSGIYTIQLKGEGGVITGKFVKQ